MDDATEEELSAADSLEGGWLYLVNHDATNASLVLKAAVKSALERSGLTEDARREVLFDADVAAVKLRAFRNAPNRGAVIALAMSALFVGLRAFMPEAQVAELRQQLRAEHGRPGGTQSGKVRREKREWVPHATELAKGICSDHPDWSHGKVAEEITFRWKQDLNICCGHRTLENFVSDRRKSGQLPQRTRSLRK
jgi:hypothetical protein